MSTYLTTVEQRELQQEKRDLEQEAVRLLGLVVAEWESDPMSVQCFDLRIVNRGKAVVRRLERLNRWANGG